MNPNLEFLRGISQRMAQQRHKRREEIRKSIKDVSVPISQKLVDAIGQLSSQDAIDVLKDHPGFKIWQRWKSYQAALAIFQQSLFDLFSAIDNLTDQIRNENLFTNLQRRKLDDGKLRIHKELFAAGNAAHSLKDHASYRLQQLVCIPDFDAKIKEHFGSDGLHDFVIGLRTINHHINIVEPNLNYTRHFDEKDDEVVFVLSRGDLQTTIDSAKQESGKYKVNQAARDYLANSPDKIDLRATYGEYAQRTTAFHNWLKEGLERQPPPELKDIQRCLKANRDEATRTWWKMLLGNWLRNWKHPPDPYQYLDRYLTQDQIDQVMRLPRKSQQQVDKIIEFADEDGACDDETRQLAYELFRKAP